MESVSSLIRKSGELVAPRTLLANNIVSQDPEGTEFPWDSQCQKGREEGKRHSHDELHAAYGDKIESVTDALNLLPFNGDAFSEMCEGQQRQQLREKVEVQWKRKAEAAAELKKRIIYECWVFKRGGGSFFSSTAYQKKYFVITDEQRLNYYELPEHYHQGGEPNGWVSCRGALVKACDGTETIQHKTCFTFTLQVQEGSCTSDILCACQTSAGDACARQFMCFDTYIYVCLSKHMHVYRARKVARDDREYRGEHCREKEGIRGAGKELGRLHGGNPLTLCCFLQRQNGTGEEGQRPQGVNFGGIPSWIPGCMSIDR
jgi:hypothetical protein